MELHDLLSSLRRWSGKPPGIWLNTISCFGALCFSLGLIWCWEGPTGALWGTAAGRGLCLTNRHVRGRVERRSDMEPFPGFPLWISWSSDPPYFLGKSVSIIFYQKGMQTEILESPSLLLASFQTPRLGFMFHFSEQSIILCRFLLLRRWNCICTNTSLLPQLFTEILTTTVDGAIHRAPEHLWHVVTPPDTVGNGFSPTSRDGNDKETNAMFLFIGTIVCPHPQYDRYAVCLLHGCRESQDSIHSLPSSTNTNRSQRKLYFEVVPMMSTTHMWYRVSWSGYLHRQFVFVAKQRFLVSFAQITGMSSTAKWGVWAQMNLSHRVLSCCDGTESSVSLRKHGSFCIAVDVTHDEAWCEYCWWAGGCSAIGLQTEKIIWSEEMLRCHRVPSLLMRALGCVGMAMLLPSSEKSHIFKLSRTENIHITKVITNSHLYPCETIRRPHLFLLRLLLSAGYLRRLHNYPHMEGSQSCQTKMRLDTIWLREIRKCVISATERHLPIMNVVVTHSGRTGWRENKLWTLNLILERCGSALIEKPDAAPPPSPWNSKHTAELKEARMWGEMRKASAYLLLDEWLRTALLSLSLFLPPSLTLLSLLKRNTCSVGASKYEIQFSSPKRCFY